MTPDADMLKAFKGRHAMVSFAEPRQIEAAAEVCQSVVLDNGAFTIWKQGGTLDVDGYVQWASHWLKHPAVEWCVIPDVIDGELEQNERAVWSWPLPRAVSVPVYHLHEPLEYLARLMRSFHRIALGSSGAYSTPGTRPWWDRMSEIMEVVCDSDGMPRVKLHGLRMLDPDHFSRLPLASADSCNVARNAGMDTAWNGPYAPRSRATRALVMMDRIEAHASARRWQGSGFRNWELFG